MALVDYAQKLLDNIGEATRLKTNDKKGLLYERRSVHHMAGDHGGGYMPFSEYIFLREQEIPHLINIPEIHLSKYLMEGECRSRQAGTPQDALTPEKVLNDHRFWCIAVEQCLLPLATNYLLETINIPYGQASSANFTIADFQELIQLHSAISQQDEEHSQNYILGCALKSSFKKSFGVFNGTEKNAYRNGMYQFGPRNNGPEVKVLSLYESVINEIVLRPGNKPYPLATTGDFIAWGTPEDKLFLLSEGLSLVPLMRDICSMQHDLLYNNQQSHRAQWTKTLSAVSNDFFDIDACDLLVENAER